MNLISKLMKTIVLGGLAFGFALAGYGQTQSEKSTAGKIGQLHAEAKEIISSINLNNTGEFMKATIQNGFYFLGDIYPEMPEEVIALDELKANTGSQPTMKPSPSLAPADSILFMGEKYPPAPQEVVPNVLD